MNHPTLAVEASVLDTAIKSDDTLSSFPLYASKISAGFPSPADDYLELNLNLNQYLIKHPAATFFVRVEGDSMIGAGIHPGDLLIVDRSLQPMDGKIIIAVLNGDLTVKRLKIKDGIYTLIPENKNYAPIQITEEMNFSIWGVVTSVIHEL
jgi:DNA polymerase V